MKTARRIKGKYWNIWWNLPNTCTFSLRSFLSFWGLWWCSSVWACWFLQRIIKYVPGLLSSSSEVGSPASASIYKHVKYILLQDKITKGSKSSSPLKWNCAPWKPLKFWNPPPALLNFSCISSSVPKVSNCFLFSLSLRTVNAWEIWV